MKNSLAAVFCLCAGMIAPFAVAGTSDENSTVTTTQAAPSPGEVPLDLFNIESGYVFGSDLNHGGSHGSQDELQNEIEYGHRIRLEGNFYVHVGVAYDRYDFSSTSSPVPNHLQDLAGILGVDYMHGSDVGAFLQIRPGFYFQNQIGLASFDVPITGGRIFVIRDDKLYVFVGAYASFLTGRFPVLPLAGLIWIPTDNLRLMGVLPNPRLIYSPNDKLDLWVGGELVGGSFRTDDNQNIRPTKLIGAEVDFTEYRAGVGASYNFYKNCSLDLGAGYSIQRNFNYGRAGETYRTDPSPYLRVALKAAF